MLKLLDATAEVLFQPNIGIEKAMRNSFSKVLILSFFFFVLIWFPVIHKEFLNISFFEQICVLFLEFIFFTFALVFYSLLIHGLASFLFKARGQVRQLCIGFAFSCLPFIFLPLFFLLPQWQYNVVLRECVFIVLFLWSTVLVFCTVCKVYKISYWRSMVLLIASLIFGSLFYVSVIIYTFASLLVFWQSSI